MKLALVIAFAVLAWGGTFAFPSQDELAKAGKLVDNLMAADLAAARAGKKTHEQVADAAMALADEAEKPAEKYLLMTGAFEEYMRADKFDDAASTLVSLREALPDWREKDESALLDKALRSAGFGNGGPVRERYNALKERQQYAAKLKKAQAASKKSPQNRKLQFQVGAYEAAMGNWPAAIEALAKGNNEAIRKAAELEQKNEAPQKIADAWWEVGEVKPPFLAEAIAEHAISLYRKALKDDKFVGLQRVAAERRVEEWEERVEARGQASGVSAGSAKGGRNVGRAKHIGVLLVGGLIKEDRGVLSGFSGSSYAKIKTAFEPKNEIVEAVIDFTTGASVGTCGLMGGIGSKCGFTPFYISGSQFVGYLSTTGSGWNLAGGTGIGLTLQPKTNYRVKCTWDKKAFAWFVWNNGWRKLKEIPSKEPVFGGLELQFGTNRGSNSPFSGTIDLNKSYICIGGKLWWEGVKGAYKKANK